MSSHLSRGRMRSEAKAIAPEKINDSKRKIANAAVTRPASS
jgi:hypothetical protein